MLEISNKARSRLPSPQKLIALPSFIPNPDRAFLLIPKHRSRYSPSSKIRSRYSHPQKPDRATPSLTLNSDRPSSLIQTVNNH